MHTIIDGMKEAKRSAEKLRSLGVKYVYPGHGRPFKLVRLRLPQIEGQ